MVKVPIGLFSRGNRKTNWWLELVVLQLENWRRDIGQILLRCIQYGNGFSISHLRVVTCDRRLKCSRYISRWDLQGTRPDLPSFLSNDRGKMHVRRRLLLVQDIRGKQKRLSLYIFVVIRVILIIRLKYISQILPCIPYVLYISYIIVQLFVFLLTNC